MKAPVGFLVVALAFALVGIATMRLGRNARFNRVVAWFWWLQRRPGEFKPYTPLPEPDRGDIEYHRQTGIYGESLGLALLFFVFAALFVIAALVSD